MTVTRCYLCEQDPEEARYLGASGLDEGKECPICRRPACRFHLVRVRWRWRTDGHEIASALICRNCQRRYAHRSWDVLNRDWIS
jgi:hypothetical protein